jgi:hypothetical protein
MIDVGWKKNLRRWEKNGARKKTRNGKIKKRGYPRKCGGLTCLISMTSDPGLEGQGGFRIGTGRATLTISIVKLGELAAQWMGPDTKHFS